MLKRRGSPPIQLSVLLVLLHSTNDLCFVPLSGTQPGPVLVAQCLFSSALLDHDTHCPFLRVLPVSVLRLAI